MSKLLEGNFMLVSARDVEAHIRCLVSSNSLDNSVNAFRSDSSLFAPDTRALFLRAIIPLSKNRSALFPCTILCEANMLPTPSRGRRASKNSGSLGSL